VELGKTDSPQRHRGTENSGFKTKIEISDNLKTHGRLSDSELL
jgi:hypothetical protein